MRPLLVWLTNTFQSPKVAMRLGLAESLLSVFLVAASAEAKADASARAESQAALTRQR